MALLQAGVDIAVIAVWLGHESIETTNVYVHANLAMKEKALAKIQPMDTPFRRFRPVDFGGARRRAPLFTFGGGVRKPLATLVTGTIREGSRLFSNVVAPIPRSGRT